MSADVNPSYTSDFEAASSSFVALSSTAAMLDGDALERLSESISTAATHITFAIFTAMEAMQGTAPAFVAQARQRYRIADKRLALQLEEFEATIKTFQTCLQHSFTDDGALEFILESVGSTNHLIDHVVPLSSTSIVIAPCGIDPLLRLDKASRVSVIGIDLNHVLVSHARWLARGEYNDVFITLQVVADNGEPVLGLSPADIVCTLDSGARGWAVTSVSISSHTVSIGLSLALDCTDAFVLQVEVGDAAKTFPLKATAIPEAASADLVELERLHSVNWYRRYDWPIGADETIQLVSLTAVCKAALSNPRVAAKFIELVLCACRNEDNKRDCIDVGVHTVVIEAMLAHGTSAGGEQIAESGCQALGSMALKNCVGSCGIIESGGIEAIHAVMVAHHGHPLVQTAAVYALRDIGNAFWVSWWRQP